MVTFFAKILFNVNEEEEAMVFSFREGTQALPGGAIVVGVNHDFGTVFDQGVIASLRQFNFPEIPEAIEGELVRFAQDCNWGWHGSFAWRTKKVSNRVWVGDHHKVSEKLHLR